MYGKLIVHYCQDKHITYKEFAKLCGVNVRSIYRWINGSTIKVIQIGEDYYTMLRELAFKSKTSLRYVAEMCIDFAAARYRG